MSFWHSRTEEKSQENCHSNDEPRILLYLSLNLPKEILLTKRRDQNDRMYIFIGETQPISRNVLELISA